MRHILVVLIVCAAAVGAAWWVAHLAGALSLQIGSLSIQAPISVALLALLLLVLVIYVLSRLVATIFHLPGAFRGRSTARQRQRGEQAVTRTLIALAAREPGDARREAARATRLLGETPQTLLLKAYAGSIAGDEAEAEAAFARLAERDDAKFLGLRGLLRLAITREDYARAAELARQAEAAHPGAAWLRGERTQLALRTGAWSEALHLTRSEDSKASLAAAAAEAEPDERAALKLARQAFRRDPALTPAAIAYARRLRARGREKAARDVLRRNWALAPNPTLADFALAPEPDRLARLKAGTALVRDVPDHPESHMLLARLNLQAGLTGDAHRHIDAARAAGLDQKRVHLLLADIAEADGHDPAQKEALRRATTAPPDPAWRCESCGATLSNWHAACPLCHTSGRVKWTVPVGDQRVAGLIEGK